MDGVTILGKSLCSFIITLHTSSKQDSSDRQRVGNGSSVQREHLNRHPELTSPHRCQVLSYTEVKSLLLLCLFSPVLPEDFLYSC